MDSEIFLVRMIIEERIKIKRIKKGDLSIALIGRGVANGAMSAQ